MFGRRQLWPWPDPRFEGQAGWPAAGRKRKGNRGYGG